MNPRDRWIIIGAILGMFVCIGAASQLMPKINDARIDLQLTANNEMYANMPPEIAVTHAMLGSFRGLFIDVLFTRAERLKNEGKYYEAMQLSEWVTKLQPRFPKVWANRAWNLAYNISVSAKTPAERWNWINDGLDLLRKEGIPLNPSSVMLHRELGYIFLHKIGSYSDEMHWYYKQQLASDWHQIFGGPPEGSTETTQTHIEKAKKNGLRFRPLADTVKATLEYHATRPKDHRLRAGLTPEKEATLLAAWHKERPKEKG